MLTHSAPCNSAPHNPLVREILQMSRFYIYMHCKPDGTPFYVGKGAGGRSHAISCGRNSHHKRVVNKYGAKNIGIFVFPCESERQALDDEVQAIRQLRAEGYVLANCTDGGEGTAGWAHTDAARLKMSLAKAGKRPTNYGKKASLNARAKMSASRKGNAALAAHCAKLSEANASRPISAETRAKMSASHKGIFLSDDARAKISASKKGKARPDLAERNRLTAQARRAA